MNIFTILTYATLILVVVAGFVSLISEFGTRWDRRKMKRHLFPVPVRRALRNRA